MQPRAMAALRQALQQQAPVVRNSDSECRPACGYRAAEGGSAVGSSGVLPKDLTWSISGPIWESFKEAQVKGTTLKLAITAREQESGEAFAQLASPEHICQAVRRSGPC